MRWIFAKNYEVIIQKGTHSTVKDSFYLLSENEVIEPPFYHDHIW